MTVRGKPPEIDWLGGHFLYGKWVIAVEKIAAAAGVSKCIEEIHNLPLVHQCKMPRFGRHKLGQLSVKRVSVPSYLDFMGIWLVRHGSIIEKDPSTTMAGAKGRRHAWGKRLKATTKPQIRA
jgi:hypothetical protein